MADAPPLRLVWADLRVVAARLAERQRRSVWRTAWGEPGWWALARFRLAQWLWRADLRGPALWWAGRTRRATGIDLHPAARIGRDCLLLGPGIVVGELAVVGDGCSLDAGVLLVAGGITPATLALSDAEPVVGRGHPSIGNRVRLGPGALVVGDVFVGDDAVVESGAVVTRDVPDGAVALGAAARVVSARLARPEPDARAVLALAHRLAMLEEQVQVLAFTARRQGGPGADPRSQPAYGPVPEVEALAEASGLEP